MFAPVSVPIVLSSVKAAPMVPIPVVPVTFVPVPVAVIPVVPASGAMASVVLVPAVRVVVAVVAHRPAWRPRVVVRRSVVIGRRTVVVGGRRVCDRRSVALDEVPRCIAVELEVVMHR